MIYGLQKHGNGRYCIWWLSNTCMVKYCSICRCIWQTRRQRILLSPTWMQILLVYWFIIPCSNLCYPNVPYYICKYVYIYMNMLSTWQVSTWHIPMTNRLVYIYTYIYICLGIYQFIICTSATLYKFMSGRRTAACFFSQCWLFLYKHFLHRLHNNNDQLNPNDLPKEIINSLRDSYSLIFQSWCFCVRIHTLTWSEGTEECIDIITVLESVLLWSLCFSDYKTFWGWPGWWQWRQVCISHLGSIITD